MKTFEKMLCVLLVSLLVGAALLCVGAWYADTYCVADHFITEQGHFIMGMACTIELIPLTFALVLFYITCAWDQTRVDEFDEKNF